MPELFFKNEQARLQHPVLASIPASIWHDSDLFNGSIDEALLPLMQTSDEATLMELLSEPPEDIVERGLHWLAIALRHPYLSCASLHVFGVLLDIPIEYQAELAVKWGNRNYCHYLIQKYQQDNALEALLENHYLNWCLAASQHGHLFILDYLANQLPSRVQSMVAYDDYSCFQIAAENGHVLILNFFLEKASDAFDDMLESDDFTAVSAAAKNGHIEVLKWLRQYAPTFFEARKANAYIAAAEGGYVAVLDWFRQNISALSEANMAKAYIGAATEGHVEVLDWFRQNAPDLVATDLAKAYRAAATEGHVEVLRYLERLVPEKQVWMVWQQHCAPLTEAHINQNIPVLTHLLDKFLVFKFALMNLDFFNNSLYPFVEKKIASLQTRRQAFEAASPGTLFDIYLEEVPYAFAMASYLLRCKMPFDQDNLLFLLNIKSLNAVADQENNVLLRTAIKSKNAQAAAALFKNPAVCQSFLMRQSDKRSWNEMALLGLELVKNKYQPELDSLGIAQCLHAIKTHLQVLFEAQPPVIKKDNAEEAPCEEIGLPFTWEAFQAMELSDQESHAALKAYRENTYHCAWRYLTVPNPWMDNNATTVNKDGEHKWSVFENYQHLICILYLAARDEQAPALHNYTIQERTGHFFLELSKLARSNNWDMGSFNPHINRHYYHDTFEKGDKPSSTFGPPYKFMRTLHAHPLIYPGCVNQERDKYQCYFFQPRQTSNEETLPGSKRGFSQV